MNADALEDLFILNATTLAVLGTIMGALAGALSFVTRALLKSKHDEIETLKDENAQLRTERDFFRDIALHKET